MQILFQSVDFQLVDAVFLVRLVALADQNLLHAHRLVEAQFETLRSHLSHLLSEVVNGEVHSSEDARFHELLASVTPGQELFEELLRLQVAEHDLCLLPFGVRASENTDSFVHGVEQVGTLLV